MRFIDWANRDYCSHKKWMLQTFVHFKNNNYQPDLIKLSDQIDALKEIEKHSPGFLKMMFDE